jgi:Ca2+-binding RTX toxin-like protein
MKNLTRPEASPNRRWVWLAAVAGTAAIAAGIVAGAGNATPPGHGDYGPNHPKQVKFKAPKLKQGTLIVTGTKRSDKITLRLKAGDPSILAVDVGDDGSADFYFVRSAIARIAVQAGAGNDVVRIDESNGSFTDTTPTTIAGGDGNDTIAGGKGVERLLGGRGNDSIDGNGGNDIGLLGAGSDTFIWDPGDGSDTIEGQAGADTMLFNGANGDEQVDLSANGNRLRFFRTQGNITMDTAGVERVDFNALGGVDVTTINDLTATDVSRVNVELAGALGSATGDGKADRVIVNATNGNDTIDVSGDAETIKVSGLAAAVQILHSQVANDRLEVNTLTGTDNVASVGLAAGAIQLLVDGVLVP